LLFLPSERAKPPAQTLTNSQNVERICLEFWQPTLDLLIKEIRVHDRRQIIPTYKIPAAVRAIPPKVGDTCLCANQVLMVAPTVSVG
jgi:hypothetical protein